MCLWLFGLGGGGRCGFKDVLAAGDEGVEGVLDGVVEGASGGESLGGVDELGEGACTFLVLVESSGLFMEGQRAF